MRRVLGWSGLLLMLAAPAAAQTTVEIGVGSNLSALLTQDLRVPVYADMTGYTGQKLGSYKIRMQWDPALMSYSRVDPGEFGTPTIRTDSVYSHGVLWLTGVHASGVDGVFDLARPVFNLSGSSDVNVTLSVPELWAAGTFADLTAGTVNVVNGVACRARGRWGDMDADGYANSREALAILSDGVGIDVSAAFDVSLGDVDGDGLTNTRDALIILSYAVGLQIPGQRVLVVAPGACASPTPPTVQILPDSADLVIGQEVSLLVVATDAAGKRTVVPAVSWEVRNPTFAVVDGQGRLAGRASGTTAVRASLGPGIWVEVPVHVRQRRGTWHVDARRAVQRQVQLGTPEYPLASPELAFPWAAEGDTILLAPGVHEFTGVRNRLTAGVVIRGDLSGGSRPIWRSPGSFSNYAIEWYGGVRGEIKDLEVDGFYGFVFADGLRNLTVNNVRFREGRTYYGYGVEVEGIDTLRVLNSEILGDANGQAYYGIAVFSGARLLQVHDSRLENWGASNAVYGYNVDSADVRRNTFHRNLYGFELYTGGGGLQNPSAAVLVQNRFTKHTGVAVYLYDMRGVVMDGNHISQPVNGNDAVYVYGHWPVRSGQRLVSTNDTIQFRASGDYWFYGAQFDTVRIDNARWESPPDTSVTQFSILQANHVLVSNSKFLNVGYEALDVRARNLTVTASEFRGCNVCPWSTTYGIVALAYNDSGPNTRITNSTFFNLLYGYTHTTTADSTALFVFQSNTLDSVAQPVYFHADSALVTDNVVTKARDWGIRGRQSFSTGREGRRHVALRNQVSCRVDASGPTGIWLDDVAITADSNTVQDCDWGMWFAYPTSRPLANASLRGNTVLMPATGASNQGIRLQGRWSDAAIRRNQVKRGSRGIEVLIDVLTGDGTPTVTLDSNAVTLTTDAGIYISPSDPITVTGQWNNVAGNLQDGVENYGSGTRSLTNGRFVNNARWGVLSAVAFTATDNYWGNAAGPGPGVAGADSVSSVNVTTSPFSATDPTSAPPLPAPIGPTAWAAAGRLATLVTSPEAIRAAVDQARELEIARHHALADEHRAEREAKRSARQAEHEAQRSDRPRRGGEGTER